jgi:isoaspartyl peptidase/L-asparaginase-like protein (Ntn-hydrolase superfamily)
MGSTICARTAVLLPLFALAVSPASAGPATCAASVRFAVVVHGGEISKPLAAANRLDIMRASLTKARAELAQGASSLDVVEEIVRGFEDSGAFNAGKGAIANAAGAVETDASIMDGNGLRAGAVASMLHVKNPVHAARLVMDGGRHVLLVGDRGEAYVTSLGAETAPDSYFLKSKPVDHAVTLAPDHGTVGAVALDRCGHIAAATSTGGYDAKIPGRVGDSPIVGAGVYAEDAVGGFSATGHGEYFIRFSVAKDVADRMRYGRQSLAAAMKADIHDRLGAYQDADGALIGLDARGNVAMDWNAVGLFRGYATDIEAPTVAEYEGFKTSKPRR